MIPTAKYTRYTPENDHAWFMFCEVQIAAFRRLMAEPDYSGPRVETHAELYAYLDLDR